MIVVIADDLTGAAELAGIALRFGRSVALQLHEATPANAEVIVICSDTRSMDRSAALAQTRRLMEQVSALQPEWVYRKIDSVMRGYVMDELSIHMELMQQRSALIIPANPSLGRTIRNGVYYVDGTPLHETSFRYDPEFPAHSSNIHDILGAGIRLVERGDVQAHDIMVPSVSSIEDIEAIVEAIPDNCALFGAGDFFTALMARNGTMQQIEKFDWPSSLLLVSGTAFEGSRRFIQSVAEVSDAVHYISNDMLLNGVAPEWLDNIAANIIHQPCIIAFDPALPGGLNAHELRTTMASIIQQMLNRHCVTEVIIEGGSTAAAILSQLKITSLKPTEELSRGVVRMQAGDLHFTVKPGSYQLPEEIKQLFR